MPAPKSPEFRRRVVELARLKEKPIAQIAKDLGIAESGLRRWMAQAVAHEELRDDITAGNNAGAWAPGGPGSRNTTSAGVFATRSSKDLRIASDRLGLSTAKVEQALQILNHFAVQQPFFSDAATYETAVLTPGALAPCQDPLECIIAVGGIATGIASCVGAATGLAIASCITGLGGAVSFVCNLTAQTAQNCKMLPPPQVSATCLGNDDPTKSRCELSTQASFGKYYLSGFTGYLRLKQDVSGTVPNQVIDVQLRLLFHLFRAQFLHDLPDR